jgi:Ni/Fe-hydrogenase subunit HybB-like protein
VLSFFFTFEVQRLFEEKTNEEKEQESISQQREPKETASETPRITHFHSTHSYLLSLSHSFALFFSIQNSPLFIQHSILSFLCVVLFVNCIDYSDFFCFI